MYDIIVVGARCAGASTAMLLARKGYKVLLVDKATFPSNIPHGHLIHRHGPQRLHRWGLLDRISATNCPAITSMILDNGEFSLTGEELSVDGVALAYGPRRTVLDKVLVDAAVEAGAELHEGFTVEEFTTYNGRISGIRGRNRMGWPLTERATITVGADGRNSRLAATVRAPVYEAIPPLTCWYFSYWSGVPHRGLEIHTLNKRGIFAFPTNDGLLAIFICWPASELATVRADIEGQFMAALDQVPELAARVRSGQREERFYGATDVPSFYRRPYGSGWALVGDAGCHKDPFMALGVCDAFRDAEMLAEALDKGLAGGCRLDTALAGYERGRNEASAVDYQQNLSAARFEPQTAEQRRLFASLQNNQEQTNRFLMARAGIIPAETFFSPQNLAQLRQPVAST